MGLRMKFNLVLLLAFIIGLALAAYLSDRILKENAREEVLQNARIMMESALGARAYTAQQIQPLLTLQMKRQFLPQTVAAYAAGQSFQALRDTFPDFTYKEAALNPTNPNDRASDWEADIIHEFRNNPDRKELVVERDTPTGPMLNLARPLGIYDEGCLVCHGKVEDAPKTMTDIYGVNNGFGWKMGEIIGAQVVTVPMSVPLARAQQTFTTFMILLTGVFVLLLVLLNILLHFVVIRPVTRMSAIASEVSMGKPDVPEYVRHGSDEIASLSQSFNRMRLSLENAMKMLGE
jgi:HAMP domain-containing protein